MEPESSNLFDLVIDQPISDYLSQTAKWAKFLSIIGIVVCGLMIVGALFLGTYISTMVFGAYYSSFGGGVPRYLGILFTVVYAAFGVLALMPNLYLLRYASKMKTALSSGDQLALNDSFRNLKSMFKFYGICMIILLSLYALAIVFALLGNLFH